MARQFFVGPFDQLITMKDLPLKGPLRDDQLEILTDAGIWIRDGYIVKTGPYQSLKNEAIADGAEVVLTEGHQCAVPGFVDAHTHICYAGSRARDYAMRLSGMDYLQIAGQGGGIRYTVSQTLSAKDEELFQLTRHRALKMLSAGITTAEVKSGYALNVSGELRLLEIIDKVHRTTEIDLIPTCLAAHMVPGDFKGSPSDYLQMLIDELLPQVRSRKLAARVDIFVEKSAFSPDEALVYLQKARQMGFDLTVHADQFTTGGSEVACLLGAISADHLEASGPKEIDRLAQSQVVPVCLPGASLGLGMPFAPARKILDSGASLAVASDWNPGSAPMGNLLVAASILGAYEHLTLAETLAAITVRASRALNLNDRGTLTEGSLADIVSFPTSDFRDIFYYQGMIKPAYIWKKGILLTEE